MVRGVRRLSVCLMFALLAMVVSARPANAQGFLSPAFGYNFGGDTGCPTATNCENKNWNLGVAIGSLGPILGFEAELTYENDFLGEQIEEASNVTTMMGSLMLAPRLGVIQPYGLVGMGVIRTSIESTALAQEQSDNQIGWNIGGGLIVYLGDHVGLKGDLRHYHSFQTLDLLGLELARDENKLDFGRAAFGLVLSF
jgi:opacity protein-like surface antigen